MTYGSNEYLRVDYIIYVVVFFYWQHTENDREGEKDGEQERPGGWKDVHEASSPPTFTVVNSTVILHDQAECRNNVAKRY